MTLRAILLGLVLGLFIACFTYFNDFVMKQTLLIGSFLPVSVFGLAAATVLILNPLLRLLGPRWPLRAGEIAVAVAIALAACAYPGANFCRYFVTITGLPGYHAARRPTWQSHQIMSYLPGGSHLLAPGHVRDWPGLVDAVDEARVNSSDVAGMLYYLADASGRELWDRAFNEETISATLTRDLTMAINHVLVDERFPGGDERMARGKLVARLPDIVMPPPSGDHAIVSSVADERVVLPLVTGRGGDAKIALDAVPWDAWWPTIRLWGGSVLLLGLAALCLMAVMHPQWSQRELLPYPIARFLAELSRRDDEGQANDSTGLAAGRSGLPVVARSRLFWVGIAIPVVVHLVNGLHAWYPDVPQIHLDLNFEPLRVLFVNAARVQASANAFHPMIYLSVVAFAFFLDRQVSFTLGITPYIYLGVGAIFVSNGLPMEYNKFDPNKMNFIRFGAFLGMTAMIIYTGRRYYLDVIRGTLGMATTATTPRYAVWAARLGAVFIIGATALLTTSGLSPLIAMLLVFTALLIWIVMTRVVCETGMFLMAGPFLPLGIWPALMGNVALGPTQILLMGIGGFVLMIDPKESLMPFLATGMQATSRTGGRVGRLVPILGAMAAVAIVVSVAVTLGLQYQHGAATTADNYAYEQIPTRPFSDTARFVADAAAAGSLVESTEPGDLARLSRIDADGMSVFWTVTGLVLFIAVAVARLRVPGFPIHPVLFLVVGTWGINNLGFSFLLGWLIKAAVVRTTGLRGYANLLPLMIGIIAGELMAALGWMLTGAIYYFATNVTPPRYVIFP